MADLTARMERHRRLRNNFHWHIDYLRAEADFHSVLPIRSSVSLECALAGKLKEMTRWTIPGFGSSDCTCPSHLFALTPNPLHSRDFLDLIQYFRMDRLFNKPTQYVSESPSFSPEKVSLNFFLDMRIERLICITYRTIDMFKIPTLEIGETNHG